jgi:flagellar biosynthesis/type III secretory pathway protein FliH
MDKKTEVYSWDLPTLGDSRVVNMTITKSPSKRLIAEVEAIKEAAYQEAYQKGLKTAEAEISQKSTELDRCLNLIIVALTQQILQREISGNPEKLIAIIRDLIKSAPIGNTKFKFYIKPEDYQLLKMISGKDFEEFSFIEDNTLSSGEVRLMTDFTEIDGRVGSRLLAITEQLSWQD